MKEYHVKNQTKASVMDLPKQVEQNVNLEQPIGNQAMLSILGNQEGLSSKTLSGEMAQKMSDQFGVPMEGIKVFENENLNAIGETAYTHGNEIHVAKGKYDPYSEQGQQILLHEAAHVVQQGMGLVHGGEESPALEAQAQAAQSGEGLSMSGGFTMPVATSASPIQGFGGGIRKTLGKMWNGVKNFFKGIGKSGGGDSAPAPAKPKKGKLKSDADIIANLGNTPDLDPESAEFTQLTGAMGRQSEGWQRSLTPEESDAVNYYTSQEFFGMNRHLRGLNRPTPQKAAEYEKKAADLSSALNKTRTSSDMVLHRGVKDDFVRSLLAQVGINGTGMYATQMKQALQNVSGLGNMVFQDKGFTSTSLSRSVAKDFAKSDARPLENQSHLIEYHAPKGTKAAYVEGLTATEDEFEMLLDRGQKYKIREILDASDELGYGAMKFIIDLINDEEDGKEK